MEYRSFDKKPSAATNKRLIERYAVLERLIEDLKTKNIPDPVIALINREIDKINAITILDDVLLKQLVKSQTTIFKVLEKELKMVKKNHYRVLWTSLGMSVFGLPIGTAFGLLQGNIGLLGIGLPIGLGIGAVIGTQLDKKAVAEGRQLNVEI